MAGKPGALLDDDDLIVELEDAEQDFAPKEQEGVEELEARTPPASTVPDEDEEREEIIDGEEVVSRAPAARGEADVDEDEVAAEAFQRIAAAEESSRQTQADAIMYRAKADAELADGRINQVRVGINAVNEKLEVFYGNLAAAEEAGDTASKLRFERAIREAEQLKTQFEQTLGSLPNPDAVYADGQRRAREALTAAPRGKKIGSGIEARHPLAERWAAGNGWMRTNSAANRHVIAQSAKMTEEGFDPNSPAFYHELGRRLSLAYPNLKVQNLQAQKRGPGKGRVRSPVAPGRSAVGGGSAVREVAGKTRFTLTAAEQVKMRRHNLDPSNQMHAKAWAKVKMQRAARERRQGA